MHASMGGSNNEGWEQDKHEMRPSNLCQGAGALAEAKLGSRLQSVGERQLMGDM